MGIIKEIDKNIDKFKRNQYKDIDKAITYIEEAIKISEGNNLKDKIQECKYYYSSGIFDKGKIEESLKINLEIKEQIEKNGEKFITKIQSDLFLGRIYEITGNYEISLEYYLEASEEAIENKDYKNLNRLNLNISEIYRKLKEYDEAKSYLGNIFLDKENASDEILNAAYTNYAEILTEEKRIEKAKKYLNKSDKICMKINDNVILAYNYKVRGRISEFEDNYKEAIEFYKQSLYLFKEAKEGVYIFDTYKYYIALLIEKNSLNKAENIIKEAENYLQNKKSYINNLTFKKFMADINYKKGNYKKSIENYKEYDEFYAKYDENVLKMRLIAVRTKFDYLQNQREKEKLEKKTFELEEKHNNFNIATEIIKIVTSTLKLDEIISKIYNQMKLVVPLDVFGIALYDEDLKKISFKEYIENDTKLNYVADDIEIDNKKSLTAYVIRNNIDIIINEKNENTKYAEGIFFSEHSKITESIVMKRLVFEGKIIGIITLQSYKKNSYDDKHLALINLITPYLAIAINNSQKSNELVKEINEREKIQQELEKLNIKLRDISNTDNLTNLYNRHYLNSIVDNCFNNKITKEEKLNLLMIDIDYFKEYNDTYGHIAGDEAIRKIGEKLLELSNQNNAEAFRYGGDEFLVIANKFNKKELELFGNKINKEVEELKIINQKSHVSDFITVSIGITQVDIKDSCNQNMIINKVDKALYESKRIGRNKVVIL